MPRIDKIKLKNTAHRQKGDDRREVESTYQRKHTYKQEVKTMQNCAVDIELSKLPWDLASQVDQRGL